MRAVAQPTRAVVYEDSTLHYVYTTTTYIPLPVVFGFSLVTLNRKGNDGKDLLAQQPQSK